MHNSSSPELSGDLDLFDKTGNDHAQSGPATTHLVGEDTRCGRRLLLQHLHHDVEALLSWSPVLVHRAPLVHQVGEAFLLHGVVDALDLRKLRFITFQSGSRFHLLQILQVFSFQLHGHLLIFALHRVLSKRMIFVDLVQRVSK